MANGIDSGNTREGSKAPATTPTAHNMQESLASNKNSFQQNISPVATGGSGAYGITWNNFDHDYGSGRWYDPPLFMYLGFFSPDVVSGGGGETRIYLPSTNNTATSFAQAMECDIHCTGGMVVNPIVDPASFNFATQPYNIGSVGVPSGVSYDAEFTRLLPKGTYVYSLAVFGVTAGSPLSGFSATAYFSTALGDTAIFSVNSSGVTSPASPVTFIVTQPWAWLKFSVSNVSSNNGGIFYGITMTRVSYTP